MVFGLGLWVAGHGGDRGSDGGRDGCEVWLAKDDEGCQVDLKTEAMAAGCGREEKKGGRRKGKKRKKVRRREVWCGLDREEEKKKGKKKVNEGVGNRKGKKGKKGRKKE